MPPMAGEEANFSSNFQWGVGERENFHGEFVTFLGHHNSIPEL